MSGTAQPVNVVTDLLAHLGSQVGCTWACSFSSSSWVVFCSDSVPWVSAHVASCQRLWHPLQITYVTEAGGDERQTRAPVYPLSLLLSFLLSFSATVPAYLLQLQAPHLMQTMSAFIIHHSSWVCFSGALITNTVCMYQMLGWALETKMGSQGSIDLLSRV